MVYLNDLVIPLTGQAEPSGSQPGPWGLQRPSPSAPPSDDMDVLLAPLVPVPMDTEEVGERSEQRPAEHSTDDQDPLPAVVALGGIPVLVDRGGESSAKAQYPTLPVILEEAIFQGMDQPPGACFNC